MRFMKYQEKTKRCLQSFEQKRIGLEMVSQKRYDFDLQWLINLAEIDLQ